MRLFAQTKCCYSMFTKQVPPRPLFRYLVPFYEEVQPYITAHVYVFSPALALTPPFFRTYISQTEAK
jgi:hypothetical protein